MEGDGQKKTGTGCMYVTLDKTLAVLSFVKKKEWYALRAFFESTPLILQVSCILFIKCKILFQEAGHLQQRFHYYFL